MITAWSIGLASTISLFLAAGIFFYRRKKITEENNKKTNVRSDSKKTILFNNEGKANKILTLKEETKPKIKEGIINGEININIPIIILDEIFEENWKEKTIIKQNDDNESKLDILNYSFSSETIFEDEQKSLNLDCNTENIINTINFEQATKIKESSNETDSDLSSEEEEEKAVVINKTFDSVIISAEKEQNEDSSQTSKQQLLEEAEEREKEKLKVSGYRQLQEEDPHWTIAKIINNKTGKVTILTREEFEIKKEEKKLKEIKKQPEETKGILVRMLDYFR